MSVTSYGFKKMNWITKRTAWQDMQIAQRKRLITNRRIEAMNSAASGFQTAQTMQIQGVSDITARKLKAQMMSRVAELQGKIAEQQDRLSKLA